MNQLDLGDVIISDTIRQLLCEDITQSVSTNTTLRGRDHHPMKRSEGNFLFRMTVSLVETLNLCNSRFNYQPVTMNPKRDLTHPAEGLLNNGWDNSENDYILRVADMIVTPEGREYEIQDLLGKGTFGQVVKCECKTLKEMVAVKVIKNKKAFKNQGVVEIKILDVINRLFDPSGDSSLVRMLDFFVFRDHLCIVFELLSYSIYDLLKKNSFQGISLNFSRLIINQILEAMKVIKEAKLIHCDLKPENILFKSIDNLNLKVIDFGSACFEGHSIFNYIQSRYYRSPEVILGLPYDAAIDMWSVGCICAELFLGIPIFPGNSEYDMLQRITEVLGPIPQHMIIKSKQRDKFFFYNPQTGYFRLKTFEEFQISTGIRLDVPQKYIELYSLDDMKTIFLNKKQKEQLAQAHQQQRRIQSLVVLESEINAIEAFIDFLKGILRLDKDTRWSAGMAMEHPFITRETWTGPFEPKKETSAHESQGADTMSEMSSSSKDSKDYKAGSCPSKILYPQTAAPPQYMQPQQQNPNLPQPLFKKVNPGQPQQQSQDLVSFGAGRGAQLSQSHRPPILSIPDEYFKGFMFGQLDQILSMTREQLVQFIYEQQEREWRANSQKMMIMQQQQQYQQFVLMQQQMMAQFGGFPQQMGQPRPMAPNFGPYQQNQQWPQFPQMPQQNSMMRPPQPFAGQFQDFGFNQQPQFPMPGQGFVMPPQHMYQPHGLQQQNIRQQWPPGLQPAMQPPQEQIIYNPPPYTQQKQHLQINQVQLNDPQFQVFMAQQQQRRPPMQNNAPGIGAQQRGKAGSWQPPANLQAQKYNQYYNQINNPGQLIGRQMPGNFVPPPQQDFPQQFFQQQFYPVPLGLQPNAARQDHKRTSPSPSPSPRISGGGGGGVGTGFTKLDISQKSDGGSSRRAKFSASKFGTGPNLGSNEGLVQNTVIEEEKERKSHQVPYPEQKFISTNFQETGNNQFKVPQGGPHGTLQNKPSIENLHGGTFGGDIWGQQFRPPAPQNFYPNQQFGAMPPPMPKQANYMPGGGFQNQYGPNMGYMHNPQQLDVLHTQGVLRQQTMPFGAQPQSLSYHHQMIPQKQNSFQTTPRQGAQNQTLQQVNSQSSLHNVPSGQLQPEDKLNSSFTSFHSGGSSSAHHQSSQSKGFLSKLTSASNPLDKNLYNAGGLQKPYMKHGSNYLVPEKIPSEGDNSSHNSSLGRPRCDSDQFQDQESFPQQRFVVGGFAHPTSQQPAQQNPVPIKYDQPIQRLIRAAATQGESAMTFEQIVMQKKAMEQMLHSSYKNNEEEEEEPQSYSIFENQPMMQSPPKKSRDKKHQALIKDRLTPIDESLMGGQQSMMLNTYQNQQEQSEGDDEEEEEVADQNDEENDPYQQKRYRSASGSSGDHSDASYKRRQRGNEGDDDDDV